MKAPTVEQKTVVITGCSSGIGLAAAHKLRDCGWTVFPTARKEDDLASLQRDGFTAIALDVADPDSVADAANRILEYCEGGVGGLVNNAGFGQPGAMEDLSREAMRYQFDVNVVGMQDLTNRILPTMRKQGWGRVVNVSSVVGRVALPFMGIYSASKFAMEAMSDVMRVELADTGIAVSIVEPGPIITNFRRNAADKADAHISGDESRYKQLYDKEIEARRTRRKKPSLFVKTPDAVARAIVHALESSSPRRRYTVTIPAHAGTWIRRFIPYALLDAIMINRIRSKTDMK